MAPSSSSSSSSSLPKDKGDTTEEDEGSRGYPLPQNCPLLCCFYAEFDNTVGPKVFFQSPTNFMDQDIETGLDEIHQQLDETFQQSINQKPWKRNNENNNNNKSTTGKEKAAATPENVIVDNVESSGDGSNNNSNNNKTEDGESSSTSIFDATSEYIITGHELAGQMMQLSTHNIHVLSRPTIITDERYERNALLFSVGFVLRRSGNHARAFRPILAKLADTLRAMEVETQFLTKRGRPQLQPMLQHLLLFLNTGEANLILDNANQLNLKLFRPPRPETPPVPEYAVPVLLRTDWPYHMIEWDLAMNWVLQHIDGVTNAKKISAKSGVDLEMVLACLRVFKHHKMIALVDMFFYSNRYECTPRAGELLGGNKPKILQEALEYATTSGDATDSELDTSLHQTLAASAASSEIHPVQIFRRQQRKWRAVLADFYLCSNRHMSVSDFWIHKLQPTTPPLESSLLPKTELSSSETTADSTTRGTDKGIVMSNADWKTAFQTLDHRRCVTFGVIHGILRRVHNFPIAIDNHNNNNNNNTPLTKMVPGGGGGVTVEEAKLAGKVAHMMNGRNCDDAIVTEFGQPLEDLIELVKRVTKRKVVSIRCTVSEGSAYV